MLVKILGIFDFVAAILLFVLSFGLKIPTSIIIFFIVVLLMKGAFVLTKSIASVMDIFAAIIFILAIYFTLPRLLLIIPAILLLQKGFFSIIA